MHGGTGIEYGLIEAMRQLKPDWPFLELVHRIDRETSGCVVLAKSRPALNHLHLQFRREQGAVEKAYLALLFGILDEVKTVSTALLATRDHKGMKRSAVDPEGQAAKSTLLPIGHFDGELGAVTYVRIQLYTGRMHQARVHTASSDLPILGDKLYGNWEVNRAAKSFGVKRCMLHAERYQLKHPLTEKLLQFNAPLPADFEKVIENLTAGGND